MKLRTVPDYAGNTDDELLRLALEPDSLTAEARATLSDELGRRRLDSPARLAEFSKEQDHYKHLDDIDIGNLTLSSRAMVGGPTDDRMLRYGAPVENTMQPCSR